MINQSKIIVRNAFFLNLRVFFTTIVNLFLVRILFQNLGEVDYGIYCLVGGLVTFFAFFTNTLTSSAQRFFSYEIGRGNQDALRGYFSQALLLFFVIGLFIVVFLESVGLWLLKTHLVFPDEKREVVLWVYHISIITLMFSLARIPYVSLFMSKEKMAVFSMVGIAEEFGKLILVLIVFPFQDDKLLSYAVVVCGVSLGGTIYIINSALQTFSSCRILWKCDKKKLLDLCGFSCWNLFGAAAGVVGKQGNNVISNLFFGPTINASRGIVHQANYGVELLAINVFKAFEPKITKLFAEGKKEKMLSMISFVSRFSFVFLLILSLPLALEIDLILSIWLGTVPDNAPLFFRLAVTVSLINTLGYPLMAAIQANGRIGLYQFITGGLLLSVVPVSYYFLERGGEASVVYIVSICFALLAQVSRVFFMQSLLKLDLSFYLKDVLLRVFIVASFTIAMTHLFHRDCEPGFERLILSCAGSLISGFIGFYLIGLRAGERNRVTQLVIRYLRIK